MQYGLNVFTGAKLYLCVAILMVVAAVSAYVSYHFTSQAYQKSLSEVSEQLGSTRAQLTEKQATLDALAEKRVEIAAKQVEVVKEVERLKKVYVPRVDTVLKYVEPPLAPGETDCDRARTLAIEYFKELHNEK